VIDSAAVSGSTGARYLANLVGGSGFRGWYGLLVTVGSAM